MRTPLPIANGFYVSESLPVSGQNCVNWYPHIPEAPALNQEILLGTPGITEIPYTGSAPADINRGMITFLSKAYFVNGNSLYSVDSSRTVVSIGSISGSGRVSMAVSGTQLMILVQGGAGYIVTPGVFPAADTLTTITDPDFTANGAPQLVVYVDGYFVCTTDENGKFIISAINDGLAWNALDFGTAESSPDDAVAPVIYKNQLIIIGTDSSEQYANSPNGAAFPFLRTGLFLDKGTRSPFSIASIADTFMFVGAGVNESPCVWALSGNSMVKVSTTAVDNLFQNLTLQEIAAVYAWTYAQNGHFFVGFALPATTIVYDVTTERWHERSSRVLSGGSYIDAPYRVSAFALLGADLYATDIQDSRLGIVSLNTYTEYGQEIIRTFTTQPFQNNMEPFFVPKLELTIESGVGLPEITCCFPINTDATLVEATGSNITIETAQDVTGFFSEEYNAAIVDGDGENISTTIPHADILGIGTGAGFQFYAFTVCNDNAVVVIDTAQVAGMSGFITVYDSGGSSVESGTSIETVLNEGTYTVRVSDGASGAIPNGAVYLLYLSVSCFEQAASAIEPSMRLSISRDGAKTWGPERSRPLGKIGEYNRRAVWRRNGRCERFDVYRFVMSDPVKPVAIQLTAQLEAIDDASA
jgi:hypothetical protein